jgi:hypothetical protein
VINDTYDTDMEVDVMAARERNTRKQHARVYSATTFPSAKDGVPVVVSPPGNEFNAVVAAVKEYRRHHDTNPYIPDVQANCSIVWGKIELTDYGKQMQRKGPQLPLFPVRRPARSANGG